MGVSAVGKTATGICLSELTGWQFIDADALHDAGNIEKMRAGIPLTDDDRLPWLRRVASVLAPGTIVACSALRRSYRDTIRSIAPGAFFVHLTAEPEQLRRQALSREGHFMPSSMLPSQLDLLEPLEADERGFTVSVGEEPAGIAAEIYERLAA